jgi:FMN phosphatase YigB (HAD superfamily)
MMIRAIVFDFGNVIGFFDHRLITSRLACYSDVPAESIHAFLFGGPLECDYETGRITTSEFLDRVRSTCRLDCSDEVVLTSWADIFWPNEQVIALLPRLKPHYRLVLGSNTNELHTAQFCRQFADALRHFDHLVFSHDVGARKPELAFFEHCRRLAGCAPEECLFIDDLPANVAGARACGWQAVVYTDVRDLRQRLAALGILSRKDGGPSRRPDLAR